MGLPAKASVVVIGGGAVGASVLYHLAKRGMKDLLLVEKNELTAGSTWHAAGNCPTFAGGWTIMRIQKYSQEIFATLAEEVDYPMNYHQSGAVRVANNDTRAEEFAHVTGLAAYLGLHYDLGGTELLDQHYPLAEKDGVKSVIWDELDGDIDPAQLTQAYAKGARDLGAKIERFCNVTALKQHADGHWTVSTTKGDVEADIIINAAGYYAPEVGRMMGRDVPSVVLEHQYLITEPVDAIADRESKIPLLRDPDDSYYLRQEGKGLMLGPYEHENAVLHWTDGNTPDDFSFQLFNDDLDRLETYIEAACNRVPALGTSGVTKVINGPIPYTPDGLPLIGPVPDTRNAYEACVFSFGIAQSGGAGKIIADHILDGETEWETWSVDPRRFTDFATPAYREAKAREVYEYEYAIGFPFEEKPAGRPVKMSSVYDILKAKGAVFGPRGGWERAVFFADPAIDGGATPDADGQIEAGWHRQPWAANVAAEVDAVTKGCGIIDMTGFSRYEVTGSGAAAALDTLIAGRLPKVGRVTLSYVCTPSGGVLSEFTIARMDTNRYWLTAAAGARWHDRDVLSAHLDDKPDVAMRDITDDYGTLVLAGPASRDVLGAVTDASLASGDFSWLSVREIDVAGVPLAALRISYVGELGYELHAPFAQLGDLYRALDEAGRAHGMRDFGMYAMESMRLEKGYRGWKSDLTVEFSALEAGLDRFISLDKAAFPGRGALQREFQSGSAHKFCTLRVAAETADPPPGSLIYLGDALVGYVSSAGYGHRTEQSLAMGYVKREVAENGHADRDDLHVMCLGKPLATKLVADVTYDPSNERMRV
ncbi:MAG: FAD-dependent oxidoreductase [Pseudomonadota bacterium]